MCICAFTLGSHGLNITKRINKQLKITQAASSEEQCFTVPSPAATSNGLDRMDERSEHHGVSQLSTHD